MKKFFISSFIIILLGGCYKFYFDIQPRNFIVNDEYQNIDTSFLIKDYMLCYWNGRYDYSIKTNNSFDDSIMKIFQNSLRKINVNTKLEKGYNVIPNGYCNYQERRSSKDLIKHLDSIIKKTTRFSSSKQYILPYFVLIDTVINTSFNTGNVYVNRFSGGVMIFIIKNKEIAYAKFVQGMGVGDNKEKVTDDWPNYPSPPDVLYEQAHWDTLVGLAMADYMKRLNVEKR